MGEIERIHQVVQVPGAVPYTRPIGDRKGGGQGFQRDSLDLHKEDEAPEDPVEADSAEEESEVSPGLDIEA